MTVTDRPPIPEDIKREVRQRSGFGCVVCGLPLYEYDHIVDYSETKRHKADELTLLCPNHHAQKTKHQLPLEKVVEANNNPKNRIEGVSEPYGLHFFGNVCNIRISRNNFVGYQTKIVPLLISDEEVIAFNFAEGSISLSANIHDRDGNIILVIDRNELVYSVDPWDIEFVGKTLSIRNGPRDFHLEISFVPPSWVHIKRLALSHDGIEVRVDKEGLHIELPGGANRHIQDSYFATDCVQHGIVLGSSSVESCFLRM